MANSEWETEAGKVEAKLESEGKVCINNLESMCTDEKDYTAAVQRIKLDMQARGKDVRLSKEDGNTFMEVFK
jgi:hypothetical protein